MSIALGFTKPLAPATQGSLLLPDPRLEMPSLFYPGRKPVANVKIDWSHPLTKGLWVFVPIIRGIRVYNIVDGEEFTEVGGTSVEQLLQGTRSQLIDKGNYLIIDMPNSSHSRLGADDWTITFDHFSRPYTNTIGVYFGFCDTALPNSTTNGGGSRLCSIHDSNWHFWPVYGDWATGVPVALGVHEMVSFTKRGGVFYLHINGKQRASGSATVENFSDTTKIIIGGGHDNATSTADFDLTVGAIHSRGLSDQEIKSLHDNPYQFLIPA